MKFLQCSTIVQMQVHMADLFGEAANTNWSLRILEARIQPRPPREPPLSGNVLRPQVP